jgi:glutamine synthetase
MTTPIAAATPTKGSVAGPVTVDELRAHAAGHPAEMVLLAVPDMQGRLQGKRIPAGHFLDRIVGSGAEFCAYLLATDAAMQPVDGYAHASWTSGYGDMRIVPDLTTLRRLGWPGSGTLVIADAADHTGTPLAVAPRTMLKRELMLLKEEFGLTAQVGLETEFTLYHGNLATARTHLRPASPDNLDYHLTQPHALRAFLEELEEALIITGLPLEAVKTEAAPGQVEITFRHGDPLQAADQHPILKHAARAMGGITGLTPTFMAAPQTGTGNGLHIHISLWDDGLPTMASDDGKLLSTATDAIGGMAEVLPQLMPLMLPNVNSYKRLRSHSFAPTRMAWGYDNRTCAIRVTGHGAEGRHLEIRIPGADANPYLALTAVIAAIRHGLHHSLKAPHPIRGDAYQAVHVPEIPRTLHEAKYLFASSTTAASLLGDDVIAHYNMAARHELSTHATEVTDIERQRGLHL